MKRKNLISGLLAGALVLTSVVIPGAKSVNAEEYDLTNGLVASYSFDNEDLTDGQGGADASAVVTGLGSYSGSVSYEEGVEGQAIRLGDYGLKLNQQNLGEDFTVSMWLKPDKTLADNQSVLFLGHHNPEKWLAVAGTAEGPYKFWANGNGYSWGELGRMSVDSTWHQMTVTGSASGVAAYLDGELIVSGKTNSPLSGSNQDIYVGVTNWDVEFTGLVDEVKVYNRTLNAGEAYRLYDGSTPAEELLDQGITVTESLNMVLGRSQQIQVSMHPVAADSNPEITYESNDSKVASVAPDGTVTALGAGTAEITTSVTIGGVTETGTTSVSVTGALEDTLVASFDFEDSLDNGVEGGAAASALVEGLSAYSGAVAYEEGRTGGKAVHLGAYGLKLNQEDLGTEYTVSMWVKSDSSLIENQIILFMGYHDPENWISISGSVTGTNKVKFWGNGGVVGKWTTLATSTVPSGEWHQITVTGSAGETTLYMDGISLGTAISNDPLSGENADIYIGVNNWDDEFVGLVDEVKIYNIAMSQEEVQNQAKDIFQTVFEQKAEASLTLSSLLGDNKNKDNIIYDLELPTALDTMSVSWSSSNPDVIANDGTVTSPSEDTEVSMTATVTSGVLSYQKTFAFTVKGLDRSELDALISEAEKIDTTYLTEASKARLAAAIQGAKDAENSFAAVEKAQAELQLAMDNLYYLDEAVNPFAYIADPETEIAMKEGETKDLFAVPEAVSDYVTVEYASENDAVATYKDGTVTAAAEGKVIVTATVTAKYDGFKMEYSTAVEVTGSEEPTETPTPEPTEEPTETPTPEPTEEPTETPTPEPSEEPTETPTPEPTEEPTKAPTQEPTGNPTGAPTGTGTPTSTPGAGGTQKPSGSGQGTAQGGQSAQTGDPSSMVASSVTAAGAALLLAAAVIVRRRRKNS